MLGLLAIIGTSWSALASTPIEYFVQGKHHTEIFVRVLVPAPSLSIRGVIVFEHGMWGNGGQFVRFASELVPLGYVVALPDIRGHGRSEGDRGDVEDFDDLVSDLRRVVSSVVDRFPGHPLILGGFSLGGLVTFRLMERDELPFKVDRVFLVAPALSLRSVIDPIDRVPPLMFTDPLVYAISWIPFLRSTEIEAGWLGGPENVMDDPVEIRRVANDPLRSTAITLRSYTEMISGMRDAHMKIRHWPQGPDAVPLLVAQAEHDHLVSQDRVEQLLQRGYDLGKPWTWFTVPGVMHDILHCLQRERLMQRIRKFLSDELP